MGVVFLPILRKMLPIVPAAPPIFRLIWRLAADSRLWEGLAWGGLALALLALPWSKALLSIAVPVIAAGAWGHWLCSRARARLRGQGLLIVLLFALSLWAGGFSDSQEAWLRDLRQKLPLLLLGLAALPMPVFSRRGYEALSLLYQLPLAGLALPTLWRAFGQYEATLAAVARNSNIDIAGSISHIYYGLLLAFGALLALAWALEGGRRRWAWAAIFLLQALFLHLLTSRTGLLAFYAGLGALLVALAFRRRRYGLLAGALLLLAALPLISYYAIPSFRLRVHVSLYDYQQYRNPEADLTDHSLSMRLLAWEAAWELFRAQPLRGVGIADLEAEMQAQYLRGPQRADPARLPQNPHNQYLEYLAGFGLPGLLLLLPAASAALLQRRPPVLAFAYTALILTAMATESILERQVGMCFFAIFAIITAQMRLFTDT
jgi:O-antigen ligase